MKIYVYHYSTILVAVHQILEANYTKNSNNLNKQLMFALKNCRSKNSQIRSQNIHRSEKEGEREGGRGKRERRERERKKRERERVRERERE